MKVCIFAKDSGSALASQVRGLIRAMGHQALARNQGPMTVHDVEHDAAVVMIERDGDDDEAANAVEAAYRQVEPKIARIGQRPGEFKFNFLAFPTADTDLYAWVVEHFAPKPAEPVDVNEVVTKKPSRAKKSEE